MNNTPTKKFELKPLIYSYFELIPNEEPHVGKKEWSTWQCKSEWCQKKVTIRGSTNSNLRTHLNSIKHFKEKEEYEKKTAENLTPKQPNKRLRITDETNECESPVKSNNLLQMGISKNVTPAKIKFKRNHPRQIDWSVIICLKLCLNYNYVLKY